MNILSYIFMSKKYLLEHLIIAFPIHWKQNMFTELKKWSCEEGFCFEVGVVI